jgi:cytochrome c peroxidase
MKAIITYSSISFLIISLILQSCKKDMAPMPEPDSPYTLEYGSFPPPSIAPDNQLTKAGVKLGRMLFYEKMLSKDNSMSCGTCHNQQNAFSDPNRFSLGVRGLPGLRHSMAIFNMAWNTNSFFWDGRAHLLREQSLMPIQDHLELDETLPSVISKLQATTMYSQHFKMAFGTETITAELISKALEQFMNSVVSNNSKFDQYLAGNANLTEEEERGRFLFFTEYNPSFPDASGADCQHCHGGSNFENDNYMNNGLDSDASISDIGRQVVTNNPSDRGKFKVTSLRNIELTSPYMHDGRFTSLEEVVEHYNLVVESSTIDGSFLQQTPNGGLHLSSSDKAALVAFLKTLTDYTFINNPEYSNPFN